MPARVAQEYADIAGAPIKVSLRNANAVGVVGKDDELYTMLKNMLIDLISRQYSGDLSIYMLLDEKKEKYAFYVSGNECCKIKTPLSM